MTAASIIKSNKVEEKTVFSQKQQKLLLYNVQHFIHFYFNSVSSALSYGQGLWFQWFINSLYFPSLSLKIISIRCQRMCSSDQSFVQLYGAKSCTAAFDIGRTICALGRSQWGIASI
ncbi:hypothetical protein XENOCAPTIV_016398 [Xenoophorus captivus]|uniref:Uncharacterized protein n=1 Tax=Xenoophorus captivus TaxID=1517983 RepID=A0ABV0QM11_9TELE